MKRIAFLLIVFNLFLTFPGHLLGAPPVTAAKAGYSSLTELTKDAAEALKKQIGVKKIAVDKSFIKDSATGDTANISAYIKNELEASFSNAGFTLIDDIQDADYFITVSYQKDRTLLRVFIKYRKSKGDMTYQSLNYPIRLENLPKDALDESLDVKIIKLSGKISQNQTGLKIFMNPIVEASNKYSCDFSNYLTLKIKTNLSRSGINELIDEKPAMKKLSNTRGLDKKASDMTNLATSDAAFVDADAVLEGYYFEDKSAIHVNLILKNIKGKVLASADEKIDKSLVTLSTENSAARKLAEIADVSTERSDNMIKISANKGSKYQVYYEHEVIKFNILVGKPMYVHIYNIDSTGNVNLLYPGAKDKTGKFQPTVLYTIPMESDTWKIVVTPPFGTDNVKVFAFDQELAVPKLNTSTPSKSFAYGKRALARREEIQNDLTEQVSINQEDIVDYYRGAAKKLNASLYEDSIFIQTKEK